MIKAIPRLILVCLIIIGFVGTPCAQTQTKISMADLPLEAHTLLHGKYAKYRVNSIYRKQDKKEQLTFEVEVQKKSKVVTLTYNAEGDLLETRKTREIVFDGTDKPNKHLGGREGGHAGHSH